jgi:hypothetical protein
LPLSFRFVLSKCSFQSMSCWRHIRLENTQYINIIHAHTHIHTWYILQPQFIWSYKKPMVHFRLINVIVFCHVYFGQMLYINGIHYSCPDPTPLWPLCTKDFSYFQKSPLANNVWNRQNRKFTSPVFTANMFAYSDIA